MSDLPELPENEKEEITRKAIEGAGHLLLMAFTVCKLETHITGSIINDHDKSLYELTFRKIV